MRPCPNRYGHTHEVAIPMGGSIVGEFIGLFCGIASCVPYLYQIRAQAENPTKSPVPRSCWLLWSFGYIGPGAFFLLVPRAPGDDVLGEPLSPRSLGAMFFCAALSCQLLWAMYGVSPAADKKKRIEELVKMMGPLVLVSCALIIGIALFHGSVIKSRPFYRDFLALVVFILLPCGAVASVQAALHINPAHIAKFSSDVAGLHWMPVGMQMLGYFASVFTCTLIYKYPEWYGVTFLSLLFAIDLLYIGMVKYRLSRPSYDRLPT